MTEPDLFAAADAARDAGIATADATVSGDPEATALVERVTQQLLNRLHEQDRQQFTADEIGALLDTMQVSTDLATRRRLVSTIINRGKGTMWKATGYAPSTRRHSAPIALWQLTRGAR
jgi:hypothetical protein